MPVDATEGAYRDLKDGAARDGARSGIISPILQQSSKRDTDSDSAAVDSFISDIIRLSTMS